MGRHRVGDRDAVLEQPRDVGEMLVQRAAERDVHHLHAPADGERREAEALRGEQQVDLELVPVDLDAVRVLRVGVSAVAGRMDVAAAHQQQPVERRQDLLGVVRLAGAHDQDARAGSPERVDVRARDAVAAVGPSRDATGSQVIADDRDQRSVRSRSPGGLPHHPDEASEQFASLLLVGLQVRVRLRAHVRPATSPTRRPGHPRG